jgi:hypothetical protein
MTEPRQLQENAVTTHQITSTVDSTRLLASLPQSLQLHNVSIDHALAAIAARLTEIAEQMPMISDIDCTLTTTPDGRCALHFRACR